MYDSVCLLHWYLCWSLAQEGLTSDHHWFTRRGGNPWGTDICQTRSEPHPPSGCMDVCQHYPPPTRFPLCPEVKRKDERGRYEALTRGKMDNVDFSNSSVTAASPNYLAVYVYVFTVCVCVYSSYSVCTQHFTACINAKSAAKRVVRPLCVTGWVSMLFTEVVVGAATEPHPLSPSVPH